MSKMDKRRTTADMMIAQQVLDILFMGACEYVHLTTGNQSRNKTRDNLYEWAEARGWTHGDVQISDEIHGEAYDHDKHGPAEKWAIQTARLRVVQFLPSASSNVTPMEILTLASAPDLPTVIWFYGPKTFSPEGLGDRNAIAQNEVLKETVGELIHSHLWLYANGPRQQRNELLPMLDQAQENIRRNFDKTYSWSNHITIVEGGYEEVQSAIVLAMSKIGSKGQQEVQAVESEG